jgi:hypothetical protein
MSAFALRKKLLGQNPSLTSPPVTEDAEPGSPKAVLSDASKVTASPEKKTRKARSTRSATREHNGPSAESISQTGVAPVELPNPSTSQADYLSRDSSPFSLEEAEDDGNTPITQPVSFSSFRPSKNNFRKKNNGVIQLKLVEGEVSALILFDQM